MKTNPPSSFPDDENPDPDAPVPFELNGAPAFPEAPPISPRYKLKLPNLPLLEVHKTFIAAQMKSQTLALLATELKAALAACETWQARAENAEKQLAAMKARKPRPGVLIHERFGSTVIRYDRRVQELRWQAARGKRGVMARLAAWLRSFIEK